MKLQKQKFYKKIDLFKIEFVVYLKQIFGNNYFFRTNVYIKLEKSIVTYTHIRSLAFFSIFARNFNI